MTLFQSGYRPALGVTNITSRKKLKLAEAPRCATIARLSYIRFSQTTPRVLHPPASFTPSPPNATNRDRKSSPHLASPKPFALRAELTPLATGLPLPLAPSPSPAKCTRFMTSTGLPSSPPFAPSHHHRLRWMRPVPRACKSCVCLGSGGARPQCTPYSLCLGQRSRPR